MLRCLCDKCRLVQGGPGQTRTDGAVGGTGKNWLLVTAGQARLGQALLGQALLGQALIEQAFLW